MKCSNYSTRHEAANLHKGGKPVKQSSRFFIGNRFHIDTTHLQSCNLIHKTRSRLVTFDIQVKVTALAHSAAWIRPLPSSCEHSQTGFRFRGSARSLICAKAFGMRPNSVSLSLSLSRSSLHAQLTYYTSWRGASWVLRTDNPATGCCCRTTSCPRTVVARCPCAVVTGDNGKFCKFFHVLLKRRHPRFKRRCSAMFSFKRRHLLLFT